jgi:hypothetical protein
MAVTSRHCPAYWCAIATTLTQTFLSFEPSLPSIMAIAPVERLKVANRLRSSSMGNLLLGKTNTPPSSPDLANVTVTKKHRKRTSSLNGIQRPTTSSLHPQPEPPRLHSISKHSPFGALLSRTLPNYTGKYEVGVCDLEIPVPRKTFGAFRYKQMPDSEIVGIAMDTVLCSLFYPCERQEKQKGVAWFPK